MPLLKESNQNSELDKRIQAAISDADSSKKNEVRDTLFQFLQEAAVTEHLLAMQYLFACFSMKKYPEEFSDYKAGADPDSEQGKINSVRLAQLEIMRRWEANMLMVSREEMTHLCYVMNLLAIIDKPPYLFRPNFPVPPDKFPLQKPVNLMPFSRAAVEVFRYWEKPSHIPVPDPLHEASVPEHIRKLFTINAPTADVSGLPEDQHELNYQEEAMKYFLDVVTGKADPVISRKTGDPLTQGSQFNSIEKLYQYIKVFFYYGLKYNIFEGMNMERIVDEHYGFNMNLDPLVLGQYDDYVEQAIQQIIEEGEGVGGIPPPLGSHFWVYQTILDEFDINGKGGVPFSPGLPVIWNPTLGAAADRHLVNTMEEGHTALIKVTNPIARDAMELFNLCYNTVIGMLNGFFSRYSIDQTTGIHPPQVNAYFQTAFYPFMTMIFRPLGELICRLPVDAGEKPEPGKLPLRTAGPEFFMDVNQLDASGRMAHTQVIHDLAHYMKAFKEMEGRAKKLADDCKAQGYHVANYGQPDARDFDVCFNYLVECFHRIGQNFQAYWEGKMVAPVSSKGFQNYSSTFN
jgi:hypothetical protein